MNIDKMEIKLKRFMEKKPPVVMAVQFNEKDFLKFEPVIHRSPLVSGFVHTGTGDIVYPVRNGDWLCVVREPLFPFGQDAAEFIEGRTFIMSDEDFQRAFRSTEKAKKKKDEVKKEAKPLTLA